MALILDNSEPAINRGIKTVGVGKKGSKPLTPELAAEILADLTAHIVADAAKGAFFAGLLAKGIEPQEVILEQALVPGAFADPHRFIMALSPDAPDFVRWICVQLLNGHTLDRASAHDVGKFLFSTDPGDAARGLIASYLRVRYETADEYEGIWQAMQETLTPAFCGPTPKGRPIIQFAEPFDGNDHSYMITPLIADYVQTKGYRAMHMVGRNSGPKLVFNLLDVAAHLPVRFARSNEDFVDGVQPYGWFFHQKDLSPDADHWVDLRHQTIKRPFLATLEKFIKPIAADIMVTSAFHPPYGEKMLTMSERAGFPGAMVIRNGIEGSIAFPLKRPAKILLSARQKDGTFLRHELTIDVEALLGGMPALEETRGTLSARENARLIVAHAANGKSGDEWFDLRVKATCLGFEQALAWLEKNVDSLAKE